MSTVATDSHPSVSQHWQPQQYARNARYVADLAQPLLAVLQAQAGERILDLGCGDGVLTRQIQNSGATVLGVDGSAAMVAAAQVLGVAARPLDGQQLPFADEFDAIFSNAALHWMTDSAAVAAGMWRALKPGGRLVAEFGGAGNVAKITAALRAALAQQGIQAASPWYFPSAKEYAELLATHGFQVISIDLFARPTPLPGGMTGWLETFAAPWLAGLPAATQAQVIEAVITSLRSELCDEHGVWQADYVRLRVHARKPAAVPIV